MVGAWVVGAWVLGAWVVGAWVVGAWVLGAWVVGAWVVGAWVGGAWVVGAWLVGAWVVGTWVVGTWVAGGSVVAGSVTSMGVTPSSSVKKARMQGISHFRQLAVNPWQNVVPSSSWPLWLLGVRSHVIFLYTLLKSASWNCKGVRQAFRLSNPSPWRTADAEIKSSFCREP